MNQNITKKIALPVILFKDTGELGNRLVTYAFLVALSLEYKTKVINLCFWRYRPHLKWRLPTIRHSSANRPNPIAPQAHLENCRICRFRVGRFFHKKMTVGSELFVHPFLLFERISAFVLRFAVHWRISRALIARVFRIVDLCSDGHKFSLLIPKNLGEVSIIDHERVLKHSDAIRRILAFRNEYVDEASFFVKNLCKGREPEDKIITVHVRKGDYFSYKGGKYFFEDSKYNDLIAKMKSFFRSDLNIILASNEDTSELAAMIGTPVARPPDDPVTTLCILAQSDLIVGPPSTFSGWASFMGATPITFLSDMPISMDALHDKSSVWTPRWY